MGGGGDTWRAPLSSGNRLVAAQRTNVAAAQCDWLAVHLANVRLLVHVKEQLMSGTLRVTATRLATRMREAAARLRWGFATAPGDSAMAVSDAWAALADVLDVVAASESASALGSAAARWHARRSSARSAALRMLGADLRTLATLEDATAVGSALATAAMTMLGVRASMRPTSADAGAVDKSSRRLPMGARVWVVPDCLGPRGQVAWMPADVVARLSALLRQRSARIVAPRPNAERPAEFLAPLALEVTVTATVAGCVSEAERACVAVSVQLPDQTVQLAWPRAEHWQAAPAASSTDNDDGSTWTLALPLYIVRPTWTGAATLSIRVVYVDGPDTPPVALSTPLAFAVQPKAPV